MTERWEKERASWILARAGHRARARRRGEKLMVAARRHDRYEVGAGDASFGEVTTRNAFHRSVMREEGAANIAGWFCLTVLSVIVLAILVGPALLVSRIAYGTWWAMVSKWGRMVSPPYLGLAAVLGGIAWLTLARLPLEGFEGFLVQYGAVQVVLGVAWAAWLVRANGWAAVARRQKQSGSKVDKILIEIPVDEPVDPVVIDVEESAPADSEAPQKKTPEAAPTAPNLEPIEIEFEIDDVEHENATQ